MGIRIESVSAMAAFVQAAELRSFKLAGQHFGLSSSAIGKTIAKLEDQLGARLFHRSTRAIALTPEGEIFLERCRTVLGELEAAEAEIATTTASPRGKLRVGLPMVSDLLNPLIGEFMKRHPEIELDLDYNDRFVDVIEDGFDAVIRSAPSPSRSMTPGRKFSMTTSARSMSCRAVSRSAGCLRSRTMLRLPRFQMAFAGVA